MEGEIMAIVTVGIDLAKNVFAVHCVDEAGKAALLRLWDHVHEQTRSRQYSLISVKTCQCSARLRMVEYTGVPCVFEVF